MFIDAKILFYNFCVVYEIGVYKPGLDYRNGGIVEWWTDIL